MYQQALTKHAEEPQLSTDLSIGNSLPGILPVGTFQLPSEQSLDLPAELVAQLTKLDITDLPVNADIKKEVLSIQARMAAESQRKLDQLVRDGETGVRPPLNVGKPKQLDEMNDEEKAATYLALRRLKEVKDAATPPSAQSETGTVNANIAEVIRRIEEANQQPVTASTPATPATPAQPEKPTDLDHSPTATSGQISRCPHCDQLLSMSPVEPSAEDIRQFRICLMTNQDFRKSYSLYGNCVEVEFRALTLQERDFCRFALQKFQTVDLPQSLHDDIFARVFLSLALYRLEFNNPDTGSLIRAVPLPIQSYVPNEDSYERVKQRFDLITQSCKTQELIGQIYKEAWKFHNMCLTLHRRSEDANFWTPTTR